MAASRRIAFCLLEQEKTLKCTIQGKQLKATLNQDYLLPVMTVWYTIALIPNYCGIQILKLISKNDETICLGQKKDGVPVTPILIVSDS